MEENPETAATEPHEHEHEHEHRHAPPKRPMKDRFTALLLQWAKDRRPKASKPRKEMAEDELKAWKTERNRRRRIKLKAARMARTIAKGLGKRPPAPNTCRRRRLAARRREEK